MTDRLVDEGDERPYISVIVPVYNDSRGISTTLETLVLQDYSSDRYEIIAVDNGSTDETPSVIRSFADEYPVVQFVSETAIQGSYAARNAGIEQATGEILAFVDADMSVPSDWLTVCSSLVSESRPYLACDVELYAEGRETLVGAYNRRTGFPVEQYLRTQRYAPTCCLLVHRSVVDAVGTFDERLESGGDSEFGNRVADAGFEQLFTDEVTLRHPVRSSLRALLKKEFRVGRGLCQRQIFHPARYGRPGIPPRPSGATAATGGASEEDSTEPLEGVERVAFPVLDVLTTGVRASGYFSEAATHYLSLAREQV